MITTSSTLPAPVQQSFSYKLLSTPVPNLIHGLFAEKRVMPRNGGRFMRMRRYNPLPTSTVPLGNSGVTPPPVQLTAVDIDAEIQFYGQYIALSDQVTLQNQDPVLNAAAQRLGVALQQSEDELYRNILASSASFIDSVNGTNGDNPTNFARADIDDVVRTLVSNDAYTLMDYQEGMDKFGTGPIRRAYAAMMDSDLIPELENVAGFISQAQYPSPAQTLPSEWGSVSNIRFFVTSIGFVSPNSSALGNDVYETFITGMEGYGGIEQDGYSASFIYRDPILDSPLALYATVGYRFAAAFVIQNDAWVIRLRSTRI